MEGMEGGRLVMEGGEEDLEVDVRSRSEGVERAPLLGEVSEEGARNSKYASFDDALEGVGVGVFHVVLLLVSGWALASDAVEIQCISFVTPQLDRRHNTSAEDSKGYVIELDKTREGILDASIFLGMMVGGYVWGSLSDLIGRRSCIITSSTVNGLFGLASAFSPNYPVFLVFRFFSGVGVGGSFPVVFSYYCEFFSRSSRRPFVIIIAGFWIIGSIFATLLAWIVIGRYGDSITGYVGDMKMEAWRAYVMLCTFPCLSAALCMLLMPESPSFLFSKGKLKETVRVLRLVQQMNSWCRRSKGVRSEAVWLTSLEKLRDSHTSHSDSGLRPSCGRRLLARIREVFYTTCSLFQRLHLRATTVMLIIWFMLSFGYYGLLLWFPEYFMYIENCSYQKENNCSLDPAHPDQACSQSSVKCNMSDEKGDELYRDSLYVALAGVPGTVLGIFIVNIVGAKAMLTFSLTVSGLSTLLIWVIPGHQKTEEVVVILSSVFGGVSIVGWNALDVVSTSELFPVELRSTAFGLQSMLGRLGAITGNVLFGRLFGAGGSPYLPILIVAGVLIFAGLSALCLPSPHGEKSRGCSRLLSKFFSCCLWCLRTNRIS